MWKALLKASFVILDEFLYLSPLLVNLKIVRWPDTTSNYSNKVECQTWYKAQVAAYSEILPPLSRVLRPVRKPRSSTRFQSEWFSHSCIVGMATSTRGVLHINFGGDTTKKSYWNEKPDLGKGFKDICPRDSCPRRLFTKERFVQLTVFWRDIDPRKL